MTESEGLSSAREPTFEPAQKKALAAFWSMYEPVQAEIQDEIEESARDLPGVAEVLASESEEQRQDRRARSLELQKGALGEDAWGPYLDDLRLQGAGYARAGMAFSAWFDVISAFRQAILSRIVGDSQGAEELSEVLNGMSLFIDVAMANIGEAYLETREGIIARQRAAIRELSTPILQVHDQLLLLPIIGVVDTDRAKQLTQELLLAIQRHRARMVVIDITGVPVVDSKVANHLIQTIDAAELMGATVVVTGISPEIAQTMVTIGADLGRVKTLGSLRAGIEHASSILPLSIGAGTLLRDGEGSFNGTGGKDSEALRLSGTGNGATQERGR